MTLLIICSLLSKRGMGYISNFRDSTEDLPSFFEVLKKCRHKCNKMLYIKQLRPRLNMQTDSTHAKVFVSKPYSLYANLEYFNSFNLTFIYVQILENGVMRLQKRCNTISLDFACLCFFQSLSYVSLV